MTITGNLANERKTWGKYSPKLKILAGTLAVSMSTTLVSIAVVAKEILVARHFGTTDALDAFLIAFLIPSFGISVLGGSFSSAFTPEYVREREKGGKEAANRLLESTALWSALMLTLCSLILFVLLPFFLPHLASGFNHQKLALTLNLTYAMLPLLVVGGLSNIYLSALNAEGEFLFAALTPITIPLSIGVALLSPIKSLGVYALVIGTITGYIFQVALLVWRLQRIKLRAFPRRHRGEAALKKVMSQYWPMVAGSFIMSGTTIVDGMMAALLGTGSVSVLNYGNKIVSGILRISSLAIGTTMLPYFSQMVTERNWKAIRGTLKAYTVLILALSIPLIAVTICFSKEITALIFQRGAFTSTDTIIVSRVQSLLVLQVPFYLLGILYVRLVSSLRGNAILSLISLVNFAINIALNYLFMIKWGIAGIALSTSVVYMVSLSIIMPAAYRMLTRYSILRDGLTPMQGDLI